jgi:acyl-CoA dehydrogenase family protein 9
VLRHREAIVERQLVLERLADMAIDMYATACTIARTQQLLDEQGVDRSGRELALCDLFCVEAGRRFRANRLALDTREDDVDDRRRAVAAAAREAGGYFVPNAIMGGERSAGPAPSAVVGEVETSGVGAGEVGRN